LIGALDEHENLTVLGAAFVFLPKVHFGSHIQFSEFFFKIVMVNSSNN
jgi:hypothetical protein